MNKPTQPLLKTALVVFAVAFSTASATTAFAQDTGLPAVSDIFEAQRSKVVSVQTEVASSPSVPFFSNPSPGPQMGQGSGFIVDEAGYVITNNHVVDGARKIRIGFENGDTYDAKLIGSDAKIDIALLKIDAGKPLPTVKLGKSSDLKVGQWVVAIGNPFGLDYTVTAGIVSAMSRNIGAGPYDDFIQTDASINPGNSGGPLFNMRGEVIGVNTAIVRHGQGIGFAVPIDMVTSVLPQLRDNGYVVRGFIGTGIQDLNEDLAESFGVPKNHGVLVGSVSDDGPAAAAGLRPGDVVTKFDGKRVQSTHDLLVAVAETTPGSSAAVEYIRDGKTRSARLTVASRPDARRPNVAPVQERSSDGHPRLGAHLRPVDRRVAQGLGLPTTNGLLVERIVPGSAAAKALRPGDVILQVGNQTVSEPAELDRLVQNTKKGGVLRMLVVRDGSTIFVAVRV